MYHWHDLQKFNLTSTTFDSYRAAFVPEVAAQFRMGQMIPMLKFAGQGVHFASGFSTDLSESCFWITPYLELPEDPLTLS